jgi:thiamine-phosphate pyrophosphorylase
VNDRADVALIAGAAGVHLGQDDLNVTDARRFLGADRIIGFSTHNLEQAAAADRLPTDYLAVGPIFRTSTKVNADPVVGLEYLAAICSVVHKPVVAVGGIKLENVREVLQAGAHSVAVIRDLLDDPDIAGRVRAYLSAC